MTSSRERGGAVGASRPALRVGRMREYRTGVDTELLAIDGVAGPPVSLFVLCGDRFEDAQRFRTGGLSVHMLRVEGHPVSMASCALGDHQWMLARDALVARLDARTFVFEMPGFFYAVVVPPDAAQQAGAGGKCATLAEIFSRFSAYHDLTTTADDGTGDLNQHTVDPWVRAHARIQRLKRATSPARLQDTDNDAPSDLAGQMERAVFTSAVVKLLSRSLLAGVLQPSRHLTIAHISGGGANAGGTVSAALPSKSVVSDLLDAIKTNRVAPPRRREERCGYPQGWWSLNVEGVMLLLRVVRAVRGKKQLATTGDKRPRDEGPAGHDYNPRGGNNVVVGGGGGGAAAVAFGGGAARRWCGGRPKKVGNTVDACGSS